MTWRIEQGDCLEVMAGMAAGSVDAVVTDPPYYGREDLFDTSAVAAVMAFAARIGTAITFWPCCKPYPEAMPDAVHIWHKAIPIHPHSEVGNAAGHQYEQIFTYGLGKQCRVFRIAAIMPNFAACRSELTSHPTQKPLELMLHLVEMLPQGATVLDPFCGSGTTGVACIQTGRNFIGIELDAGYCEIARKRCAQAEMQLRLL